MTSRKIRPPKLPHLKPLSDCSRGVSFDQKTSPHLSGKFSNPFINFKIELPNSCTRKRKMDDSSAGDGCETPAKMACTPKTVSPDLGCFMDDSSPLTREDSVSPFPTSNPAFVNKTQSIRHTCLYVKELEDDKGYSSVSSFNDYKIGANPPDSVHSQLPSSTSSPLLRTAEAELSQNKFHSESSPKPQCHEKSAISGHSIVDSLCPSVNGPLLEPVNLFVECLQDTEEMLDIGPPIFESSVCDGVSGPGSEETKKSVTDSVHDCQDTTCDSSWSTTLPLQVQVKSKVVIPPTSSKPFAPLPPRQNTNLTKSSPNKDSTVQTAKHVKNQRAVILNTKVDWDYKKNLYVRSVTQDMTVNQRGSHGVMSELVNLMNHVADQAAGSSGTQWQHPADFTRRNYQRRFQNAPPRITLKDWLTKNSPAHKRFAKVPNVFERTPFP